MSAQAFIWATRQHTPCAKSKAVLLVLADLSEYIGPGVFLTPGRTLAELVAMTSLSAPAVAKGLCQLEDDGFIESTAMVGDSTRYRLLLTDDAGGCQA